MNITLPPIQPHTRAKHHILRYHLQEWFPILGRSQPLLRYVDGFAGPGRYEGGEPGSPLISLHTVQEHSFFPEFSRHNKAIEFLFVEKNASYHVQLKQSVDARAWPNNFKVDVQHAEFAEALERLLDHEESTGGSMAPTFLFVDPFGSAGFPLILFERLASYERVDVLINLNCHEFIRWILSDSTKHSVADNLYGSDRWRPALDLEEPTRTNFLVDEYEAALRDIGWRGTSFEMINRQNQTAYHLVFGTGNPKGLDAMKHAMRGASQTGEFRYTDRIDSAQPVLSGLDREEQYPREIGEHLFEKYEGQEITFEHLTKNEIDWHPWWIEKDLRKGLQYLEYGDDPRISDVRKQDGKIRRQKSYPAGCLITFRRPESQKRLL